MARRNTKTVRRKVELAFTKTEVENYAQSRKKKRRGKTRKSIIKNKINNVAMLRRMVVV